MPRCPSLLSRLLREAPIRCIIRASLLDIYLKVEISLVVVLVVIIVDRFRLYYKDQVVDIQVLSLLVARYQVIWVEASGSALQARAVILVYPHLLRLG